MTRFVQLCAQMEGFYKPGTVPARNHNPMDLRHSQHSQHPGDANAIGEIDNDEDGFADAELQAQKWAERGLTLQQAIYTLAPPPENNSVAYLEFIVNGFGGVVDASTPLKQVLEILA